MGELKRVTRSLRKPPRGSSTERGVLVVDDEVALARSLERVLTGAGYTVTVVHDGSAAVDAIMATPFDVILSDIQMPGLSGVDLLTIVRAYDLDVPVILMTGNPTVATAAEAVSFGALQYLVKPLQNDVVIHAVERGRQLHAMALMKRDALKLQGGDRQPGDRAGLVAGFDRALAELWMAFQPIIDTGKRRVFGYEALVRTRESSFPDPESLLLAAERLDRLPDLGRTIREKAAKGFADAPQGVTLFVNLHTRDLLDPELYNADAPLSKIADRVVLEVTERAAIDDIKDIQARVSVLRYLGFRIAIDDLGAGYAGLASFAALEPDIVKLDMSLIRNVHQSIIRQRLVSSMTALCKEMGMRVVAEGVEVNEERESVRSSGCELLQGFFFARPGPPFPVAKMLS